MQCNASQEEEIFSHFTRKEIWNNSLRNELQCGRPETIFYANNLNVKESENLKIFVQETDRLFYIFVQEQEWHGWIYNFIVLDLIFFKI